MDNQVKELEHVMDLINAARNEDEEKYRDELLGLAENNIELISDEISENYVVTVEHTELPYIRNVIIVDGVDCIDQAIYRAQAELEEYSDGKIKAVSVRDVERVWSFYPKD